MYYCKYTDKCHYLNSTIYHNNEYNKIFLENFCKGHYKGCAIWKLMSNLKRWEKAEQILPFENNKSSMILQTFPMKG